MIFFNDDINPRAFLENVKMTLILVCVCVIYCTECDVRCSLLYY